MYHTVIINTSVDLFDARLRDLWEQVLVLYPWARHNMTAKGRRTDDEATYEFEYAGEELLDIWFVTIKASQYTPDRLGVHIYCDRDADRAVMFMENLAEWLAEKFQAATAQTTLSGGRPLDPWNEAAVVRLVAGMSRDEVQRLWVEDYKAGTEQDPGETSDGLTKTWNKRVLTPYLKRIRGHKGS